MRFANLDGTLIDVYQATTQMTDESEQTYPYTIDTLLDGALGSEGYYGAFTANMHTDSEFSDGSDAIVASAQARQRAHCLCPADAAMVGWPRCVGIWQLDVERQYAELHHYAGQ